MVNRRTRKTTKEAIKVPQQEFSLVRLRIEKPPFRKLKNITVEFAERVTLIAGHNGIGKSTILALIANGSGITDTNVQTYTGKPFTGLLNEIIHIDFENEYLVNKTKGTLSNPHLDYLINENEFTKRCGFTRRLVKNKDGKTSRTEVRVVPRNTKTGNYEDVKSGVVIGSDSKVPIPTIYLGMTRMIPIGESDPELILNSLDNTIDKSDAVFINKFIKDVIN
ncbi:AAA family ATPase, partial [Pseudomonas sp. PA-5-4A]